MGPEPPAPPGFGPGQYTLPEHFEKPTQRRHPCPKDAKLRFLEKPHVYTHWCSNSKRWLAFRHSVTHYAHLHSVPFDKEDAYKKMTASWREAWPKLKYTIDAKELDGDGLDALLAVGGQVLAVDESGLTVFAGAVPAGTADAQAWIHQQARRRCKTPGRRLVLHSYARAMTKQEVFEAWEINRETAANKGTHSHLMLELWCNSLPSRVREPETMHGLRFLANVIAPLNAKVYRTEWEIFNSFCAGSVDLVLILPETKELIIADWKRSTRHEIWSPYNKKMTKPFDHLDDTSVAGFSLQLSMYKLILERDYGYSVRGLVLAGVEPDHPFHTWVPYMQEETEYLYEIMKIRAAREVRCEFEEFEDDAPRCSLTGQIAWEPMRRRLPDGSLGPEVYDRPQGLADLADTELVVDEELASKANALLESVQAPPGEALQRLKQAVPWRERIPECGFPEFLDLRCSSLV